jgi:hypothetical protein
MNVTAFFHRKQDPMYKLLYKCTTTIFPGRRRSQRLCRGAFSSPLTQAGLRSGFSDQKAAFFEMASLGRRKVPTGFSHVSLGENVHK